MHWRYKQSNICFTFLSGFKYLPEVLKALKQVAIDTNAQWSKKLGINQSVAVTCVKPSGTVSQLVDSASGIHARHAPYYIRTVRADKKDPLAKMMHDQGFPCEDDVTKPDHTWVFSFPIKGPKEGIYRKDMSAVEQLELWKIYQENWCEHKPSITVSVKEDEWLDVVWPWEILTANKMIMDSWGESSIAKTAILEANVTLQGIVKIEENVTIKAGAVIEGPCSIGRGSYIGNNSLIRSYTSLGKNCEIGSGVELKNCVVMDNTQIGRLSFIGDSVLGENVDIGSGCMTVNRSIDWKPISVKSGKRPTSTGMPKLGAFFGDGVVVGAGNMIQPGTVVHSGKVIPACYSLTNK